MTIGDYVAVSSWVCLAIYICFGTWFHRDVWCRHPQVFTLGCEEINCPECGKIWKNRKAYEEQHGIRKS